MFLRTSISLIKDTVMMPIPHMYPHHTCNHSGELSLAAFAIVMHDFTCESHPLKSACDLSSPYVSMFGVLWEMGLSEFTAF